MAQSTPVEDIPSSLETQPEPSKVSNKPADPRYLRGNSGLQ